MNKNNSKKQLLLIDSNALVHRAYHAYPDTLTMKDGTPVNAVYGFAALLLDVIKMFKPEYMVCAFDTPKPTVRHTDYVGYKANRGPMEDTLVVQLPFVDKVIDSFNIPILRVEGFEADDIIGTLARKFSKIKNLEIIIVTGDHDLLQLVDEDISVYMAGSSFSKSKLYTPKEVIERYSFEPIKIIDYKSLRGDTSDNIPGVKGIGEKGAKELIARFGTLENIYDSIEQIENMKLKEKLVNGHQDAILSKKLATIITDTPISFELNAAEWSRFDMEQVKNLFHEFRFLSLLKRLPTIFPEKKEVILTQTSLFASSEIYVKSTRNQISLDKNTINDLLEEMKKLECIIVATKEEGANYMTAKLKTISLLTSQGNNYRYDFSNNDDSVRKGLEQIFTNDILKVVYDSKYLRHILTNEQIMFDDKFADIMLMSYLVNEGEGRIKLSEIIYDNTGVIVDPEDVDSIVDYLKTSYLNIKEKLESKDNTKMKKLYEEIELPIAGVLVGIERAGIKVDGEYLMKLRQEFQNETDDLKKSIFDLVGHEFNMNSPKQLGQVLFGELGLPGGKKTKTGGYSTNERVLKDLVDVTPVVPKILQYREIEKLKSTYTEALSSKILKEDGRVHTKFNQAVAATGRLSSTDPNLQNIPISSENGLKIRKAFVAEEGKILVGFDISQQELRVAANLSKDPILVKGFKDGVDIHTLTASQIFDISIDKVTKEQRSVGKTLNYSILYGISVFGLSDRLKVNREEASGYIDRFWLSFKELKGFFDKVLEDALKDGYVETYFGRKRSAQGLKSPNFMLREAAKREIINFPLQGTSAELMKLAMIAVEKYIKDNNLDNKAKVILQVHDELVMEYGGGEKELNNFAQNIVNVMQSVVDWDIPLLVEAKKGREWSDMSKITL